MTNWFVSSRSTGPYYKRLVCFPYGGGSASAFASWRQQLPRDVELLAVELPGRATRFRDPVVQRMDEAVTAIADALAVRRPLPTVFFGHSLGALLAFEVTRALRRRRAPSPQALFVSGCRGPDVPRREKPIHALPWEQFVRELKHLGGTPDSVADDDPVLRLLEPALRADLQMAETYSPRHEPRLAVPIHAMGGRQDPYVTADDIEGWSRFTSRTFTSRMVDGDHFFVHHAREIVVAWVLHHFDALASAPLSFARNEP